MKKLLLAFFLLGFVLVNAQNKDTFLLKEEKCLWITLSDGKYREKMEEDTIFSLMANKPRYYYIDTLISNDTLKLISVTKRNLGLHFSYIFCSEFGKKITYIGKLYDLIYNLKNAYYHNGTLSVFDYSMHYNLLQIEQGVFKNKVHLYCNTDKCNAYKSNLTSPFVLDMYLLNKDTPLRYFIDIEGEKIMRADLDYYEEQYFPFVNGKISLAIK